MAQVLILITMATKSEEAQFLASKLQAAGVAPQIVDISLQTDGQTLVGEAKRLAMANAADRAIRHVTKGCLAGAQVVVGIGGGTGGEIVLQVMRALPITFPKVLCTTMPFDPRFAVADNSIILVPSLADIMGLNSILRDSLENTALIAASLCQKPPPNSEMVGEASSVGITALGATEGAVRPLMRALVGQGREASVFHSNGFGGAALARFASKSALNAIIDLTTHELTRIHLAGVHIPMPGRFSAGGDLPRIVLPGAINFIGLGPKNLMPAGYLERPHYEHSSLFTHVKLTQDEMALVCEKLAEYLNALAGPCAVILPMGGFSHQDCPGGAIEDPALRMVCADVLQENLNDTVSVTRIDAHLFAPEVTEAIISTLVDMPC